MQTHRHTLFNAKGDIDVTQTGFQYAIDTLSYIKKKVIEQKFYQEEGLEIFSPLAVGEGAFSQSLITNLSYNTSDNFESGNLNTGVSGSKLAEADAAISPVSQKVINWAKTMGYTIFDIEQALRADNWDLIEAKHKSRKKNWDLGIQEILFLGSKSDTQVEGLLTQSNVNIDTTTITKPISEMTDAEFQLFIATFPSKLYDNSANTELPNRFLMPRKDYLGLGSASSPTYPINGKIGYMEAAFQKMLPGIQIVSTPYAQAEKLNELRGINQNRYIAYYHDEDTLRMDIPVDYTTTQPNTNNNFQFEDVSYGQYTGVKVFRPLEVLYFDDAP